MLAAKPCLLGQIVATVYPVKRHESVEMILIPMAKSLSSCHLVCRETHEGIAGGLRIIKNALQANVMMCYRFIMI